MTKYLGVVVLREATATWRMDYTSAELKSQRTCQIRNQTTTATISTLDLYPGFPHFHWKKIQDFSKTFKDPCEKFSRTFSEPMNA